MTDKRKGIFLATHIIRQCNRSYWANAISLDGALSMVGCVAISMGYDRDTRWSGMYPAPRAMTFSGTFSIEELDKVFGVEFNND